MKSPKPTRQELEARVRELERVLSECRMGGASRHENDRQQKAMEEKEASRRLLQSVLDAVPDLLIVISRDFRIQYTNYKGHDRIQPLEGVLGHTCYGRFKRLDAPCEDCSAAPVFAEGKIVEREMVNPADGRVREVHAFPIFNAEGRVEYAVEYVRDITARKQIEEALKESESRFRTILDHVENIPVQGYDASRRAIYWNTACEKVYGYSKAETLGRRIEELIIPESMRQEVVEKIDRWVNEGVPIPAGEMVLWDKEREPVHVYSSHVMHERLSGAKEMFCIDIDLSQLRHVEKERRDSEQRYRSLVENTMDGYFICKIPSGRFAFLNQRACEIYGCTRAEGLELTVWDVISPEDHPRIRRRIQERMAGRHLPSERRTYTAVRLDGSTFRAEISTSRVVYSQEFAVQGTLRDVTEHERLQTQLQQAQKMEAVGRLAGGVAHDFNNMLTVILGHAAMAQETVDPASPLYERLAEIRKAGQHSADLTRQLLAFARKQTVSPRVLDLNDIVEGMTRMLQRLIGEDINLVWMPGGEVCTVKMDPSQIDQILANLCVNARDAITGGGRITIETATVTLDETFCSDHAGFIPGEYVLLVVGDDGCGMDAEILSNIFEPFFTTKETGQGTGLGLATVYGVVKQNNGFIDVDSRTGRGTTVKIYLPRYRGEADRLPEKAEDLPGGRGQETILLVEDEAAILEIVTMMLQRLGYRVVPARTPNDAIRLAREHAAEIHLLVTDVVMPEMNGSELAGNLSGLFPNLKCLFMSGYTADVIAHHGILNEGVHYIQKPFSKRDLSYGVREALDSGKNRV